MGKLSDSLIDRVGSIIHHKWETVNGRVVPDTDKITNSNIAVKLNATILYADLAESTQLVEDYKWWFAGEIYKCYLECASRIIKNDNADIVAYDGDRVMAIYLGDDKEDRAVRTALKIQGAVQTIINPRIKEVFKNNNYRVNHSVSIDSSEIYAAKIGVRGNSDIVWIGKAANRAAKLGSERKNNKSIIITKKVYDNLSEQNKYSEKKNMWVSFFWPRFKTTAYRTSYRIAKF